VEVAAVPPEEDTMRGKERAATLAHANVMRAFLNGDKEYAVVLEDDALLGSDRSWMNFTEFDLFIPFSHNRESRSPDTRIQHGILPASGAFAYLCSRRFAEKHLELLLSGEIADHSLMKAGQGLNVASFAGNLVNHDNHCTSLISEKRRLHFLRKSARLR
jgi:hypothetical protein